MHETELAKVLTADLPPDERERLAAAMQRAAEQQLAEARAIQTPKRRRRGRG